MAPRVTVGGSARMSVGSLGRTANANRDRTTVMRPPRLKALPVRDYAKPEQRSENPLAFPGAGFGTTGLTGET